MKLNFGQKAVLISLLVAAVLVALLVQRPRKTHGAGADATKTLMVYCAAGIKLPVEATVRRYEQECGVRVQLQYGGSGTLLSAIQVSPTGDLYLAADDSYIELAQQEGLVAEALPLARLRVVIAVRKGNPKGITGVDDLLTGTVRVALANPDAAAVGKATRRLLEKSGHWKRIKQVATVFKPTVMDLANDIKLGSVDAGIVWDATANQYPELEIVEVPAFAEAERQVTVGVMTASAAPDEALRFARYLAARDRGGAEFQKHGFRALDGDVWANTPEILLFSGGVNRLAVEDTINAFEKREGVHVTRVYNGCGILVSQMKAGASPDAYFTCDVSFMDQVKDRFTDIADVAETDMVFLLKKGNPSAVTKLADLARPGLTLGLANAEQSALGALTKRLLEAAGVYDAVMKNVKSQTPTADLLVNQMRVGSLDAAIVYRANTAYVGDALDVVPIPHPLAKAVQSIGVSRTSDHGQLSRRLMQAIMTTESRKKFEALGFRWRHPENCQRHPIPRLNLQPQPR